LPVLITSWCFAAVQPVRFSPIPADMLVLAVSIFLLSRAAGVARPFQGRVKAGLKGPPYVVIGT
jgi:hypothetical protein